MQKLNLSQLDDLLEGILKPSRYTGSEINSRVNKLESIKNFSEHAFMALIFPDIYDIGMSNLGIKILYEIINSYKNFTLERAFLPWVDFEKRLRERKLSLFSLENRIFLNDFDILGFSIAHEMLYTNVLDIINLCNISPRFSQRRHRFPIICSGGAAVSNPMPMSDFMDFFVIGDGEEVLPQVLDE